MHIILTLLALLSFGRIASAEDIAGFWQTLDDKTKQPTSVIAIYEYEGRYFGRIIASFNDKGEINDTIYKPVGHAPGVKGNPYYCGLDIVYDAQLNHQDKYEGHIIDPREGKEYRAEIWREDQNLILRGEVFIFGKNMTWPPFPENKFTKNFKKPDVSKFVPKIPELKK